MGQRGGKVGVWDTFHGPVCTLFFLVCPVLFFGNNGLAEYLPLTLALVCSCMFFVNERYLTPEGERKWLMGVIDRPIPGLKKTVGEHGSSRPLLVGMG